MTTRSIVAMGAGRAVRRTTTTPSSASAFARGGASACATMARARRPSRAPRRYPKQSTTVVTSASFAAIPDLAFTVATVSVMPIYAVMIAKPQSAKVLALVRSKTTFWLLALCYACAAVASFTSADVFHAVREALSTPGQGALERYVTLVSGFMSTPQTASSAWVHLLSLDLFVARFVYMDSAAYGSTVGDLVARVPVRHSLVLCCMFGPLGLMSHAITRWLWNTFVTVDVI